MAYTIGVDFGTLSGRAVLVHVQTGEELAAAVKEYRHAVIDTVLPKTGQKLPRDWALQHPADYLEVLESSILMKFFLRTAVKKPLLLLPRFD